MKTFKLFLVLILITGLSDNIVRADFVVGEATKVPNINSGSEDWGPTISPDGLELYFESNRSGGAGGYDVWISRRATTEDDWGVPVSLGSPVCGSAWEGSPSISFNGLELYFWSTRSGGHDIWVTKRTTMADPWGIPVSLGTTVNSPSDDNYPGISADGLELYFSSGGPMDWKLLVTRRETTEDSWGVPASPVATFDLSAEGSGPSFSADGRALLFGSTRSGGSGSYDLWVATRATADDPWEKPVNLGSTVNSSLADFEPTLSHDGRTIYFSSNREGGALNIDIWQAPIIPIVDLNGDGIVDALDMCIMVDHWGENYPLCDIGPTPMGDGIVDVQDLIILAEHLFEEVPTIQ